MNRPFEPARNAGLSQAGLLTHTASDASEQGEQKSHSFGSLFCRNNAAYSNTRRCDFEGGSAWQAATAL